MSQATPPDDDDDKVIASLDDGEAPRTPEETAARIPYQRLIARLKDLDDIEPPPGWEKRAEQRWRARRSEARKRRWKGAAIACALGATALAVAVLLRPCSSPPAGPPVQVAVMAPDGIQRRGEAAVGDELLLQARVEKAHVELRVYRDTRLVARCPGDSRCRVRSSLLELSLALTEKGPYRPVIFSSDTPIPAPGDGIDSDLLEARAAGVTLLHADTILVQR